MRRRPRRSAAASRSSATSTATDSPTSPSRIAARRAHLHLQGPRDLAGGDDRTSTPTTSSPSTRRYNGSIPRRDRSRGWVTSTATAWTTSRSAPTLFGAAQTGRVVVILGKATGFGNIMLPDAANSIVIDGDPAVATSQFGYRVLGPRSFLQRHPGTTLVVSAPGNVACRERNEGRLYAFHGQSGTAGGDSDCARPITWSSGRRATTASAPPSAISARSWARCPRWAAATPSNA